MSADHSDRHAREDHRNEARLRGRDPWTPAPVDERVARVAKRLFYRFARYADGPEAWAELSDRAKESWLEAAREVLAE